LKKIIPVLVIFAVIISCKNIPKTGASVKSETDEIRFTDNYVTLITKGEAKVTIGLQLN